MPTSSSSPPALHPLPTHRKPPPPLLCEVEPLAHKSIATELRSHKDLRHFATTATISLDLSSPTPSTLVDTLLDTLVANNNLTPVARQQAHAALLGTSASIPSSVDNLEDAFDDPANPPRDPDVEIASVKASHHSHHWHRNVLGAGFIIPFANVPDLQETLVAIARLATSSNMAVVDGSLIRFVLLVLAPVKEVQHTKTSFELARSFSSLFQDDFFFAEAKRAEDVPAFRKCIQAYVERQVNGPPVIDGDRGDDDVFMRTGRFAGGLINDIKNRYNPKRYSSDWTDGIFDTSSWIKYLSTTVWLYFAIIMPTIAFGALDDENTESSIGVIETIISQAIAGTVFAVFAGQPLTIVMTTAPLTVFIDVLFRWCSTLDIPFLPFYAWTGLWTAAILIVLVLFDACYIMKYCGHFTEEIFATLIAALFIAEYIKPLIDIAEHQPTDVFLLAFLLATGTYLIANALLAFRRSFLLKPLIRQLLSDFGVPISILVMSGLRQAFDSIPVEPLPVPDRIGIVTTSGRPWLVPLFDINIKYIFLASVSGFLLATLFFLDQNISSMLVNKPENKLRKGPGYYLDLVVVSVIVILQSVFGMPWTHAALPHSPLHARQLADVEEYEAHGRRYERVIKSRETRITGLLTHLLVGLSILAKDALGEIPLPVLYGFFLFLGVGTLDGNALWDRILLLFTQPEKFPPNHYVRRVKILRIHLYTGIQVALLVLLWFVKSNFYLGDTVFNTGLLFPFVIALFIPVRLYILPRIFTPAELYALSKEEDVNISDTGITV